MVIPAFSAIASAVVARALPQNFVISFVFYGKRLAVGVVFCESPVI